MTAPPAAGGTTGSEMLLAMSTARIAVHRKSSILHPSPSRDLNAELRAKHSVGLQGAASAGLGIRSAGLSIEGVPSRRALSNNSSFHTRGGTPAYQIISVGNGLGSSGGSLLGGLPRAASVNSSVGVARGETKRVISAASTQMSDVAEGCIGRGGLAAASFGRMQVHILEADVRAAEPAGFRPAARSDQRAINSKKAPSTKFVPVGAVRESAVSTGPIIRQGANEADLAVVRQFSQAYMQARGSKKPLRECVYF